MSMTQQLSNYTLVAVALLLLQPSCTINTETTEGTDYPYPIKENFCAALAEVVCNAEVVTACYLSSDDSLDADTAECVSAYAKENSCNPGGFEYDPRGAEACLVAMKDAYADAKLSQDEQSVAMEACLGVFSGDGALGSSCEVDTDCEGADGLRCVAKPGAAGSCQQPEPSEAGFSCAADNAVCAEGFYCGSDQACIQQPSAGMACNDQKPCDASSRCVEDSCVAKVANGETCAAAEECAGGFCVKPVGQTEGTCGGQLILSPTTEQACEPMLS